MTRSVYIASPEGVTGKSTVALGLLDQLVREVGSVAVLRPLVHGDQRDTIIDLLLDQPGMEQHYEEALGVSYADAHADPDEALSRIVHTHGELAERYRAVLVLGSDYTDVSTPTELALNARIASNLGAQVVLVVSGVDRGPEDVVVTAEQARAAFTAAHAQVTVVVANRVAPERLEATRELLLERLPGLTTAALPESRVLSAPSVRRQLEAARATVLRGNDSWLDRESLDVLVAGMTLPNVLTRLRPEMTVIAASDRPEVLAGLVLAHRSGTFPPLAGIILVGGYEVPESIMRLLEGVDSDLPIAVTDLGTFATADRLSRLHGPMIVGSTRKVEAARTLWADHVDSAAMSGVLDLPPTTVRTPLMFEYQLLERARSDRRHIVLPESGDERVLEAAAILLRRGVADLTLLGEENDVRARASALGFDLDAARVVSTRDPELLERFAAEYARLRAHKGVTPEQARERLVDGSYFGTMMVQLGLADGMVSGAVNTTAHTIRPALEFVKTRPGVRSVSSVFLMCLADRVLAYGDCAVIPEPTAEQLADIAVSSADTARAFDIEPRVAMLSYSTGSSGSGAEVEKVREATALVRERAPELPLEGPIQYDAAIDPSVARTKLPDSLVAGRATVFVFPDLNTGNNTYKAVQRSAGAVAVGPVLQGLNKPVNDLSRGATVDDIVNTVAITCVQAQTL
ncbi:phosphate acetyltransferase [Auraticoccus monumenti]|uniref:Phosphate acetyltransferase n=1 Tax=Auraticoccus monumenti TaxID=675864 RepID=A0A1G6SWE9_9ACTN|nr:phosphate acetyltransferase [Auraticoccus monumenti]SDD20904.1 phosphate acetyltransferase [Auraticoccus monumenti]